MKISNKIKLAVVALVMMAGAIILGQSPSASALSFSISPMKQNVALAPGQVYHGSLMVTNPQSSEYPLNYSVTVDSFTVDENYNAVVGGDSGYNQIKDWIKIEKDSGVVAPNETKEINFTIRVPEDAPAGGQYAAILVGSTGSGNENTGGMTITQALQMAHLIYADVAGETVHKTSVTDLNVPSFLFGGDISASAVIKNEGNTHISVSYVLQVFPLFSNEEIYTNEEEPFTNTVVRDSLRSTTVTYPNTPNIGIFNVRYRVFVDGELMGEVEKMVIVCPMWLLFIIFFAIIMIIAWVIARYKKKSEKEAGF